MFPDPLTKQRLEYIYRALELEIAKLFPDSWIKLVLVGDKVAVTGQAKDVFEATHILQIIRANAPGEVSRVPIDAPESHRHCGGLCQTRRGRRDWMPS